MNETFYQILGIPRDADEREVKRAYHRLARELHPDKAETPEKAREVEQRFAVVSTAYNTLKDVELREEYDRKTFGGNTNGMPVQSKPQTPTSAALSTARSSASASPSVAAARENRPNVQRNNDGMLTPERIAIAQKAFVKGCQLMKEKDYAKAVDFFEAAISNNDAEPIYHSRLAVALIEAKKSASRAIQAAQRAIELDKYNLDFKFSLAHVYETIGSKSNAVRVYEEILKWDQENQMAQQMLRKLTKKEGLLEKLTGGAGAKGGGLFSSLRKKA